MSEGPTTVGSINAYLELNIDRFLAKVEEAKAATADMERKPIVQKIKAEGSSETRKALKDVEAAAGDADKAVAKVGKTADEAEKKTRQAVQVQTALIGALVAVIPAMVPLAAGATAIAGGLGVMGATGVLAIGGIVRGMKDGTQVGNLYRGTVKGLVTDLHSVQDAAARGLFPGVQQSLTMVDGLMPRINAGTSKYAALLGSMLPTGLDAVVTLLGRADPLLYSGAQYIGQFLQGVDGFAHSTAFGDFLGYAATELPHVEQFLGDVLKLTGDLLSALAPFGATELDVLDGIVTGLDHIITSAKPLVPAIAVVALAFGAWRLVAPMIDGITTRLEKMGAQAIVTGGQVAEGNAIANGGGGIGAGGVLLGAGGLKATGRTLLGKAPGVGAAAESGLARAATLSNMGLLAAGAIGAGMAVGDSYETSTISAKQATGSTSGPNAAKYLAANATSVTGGGVNGSMAGIDASLAHLVSSGNVNAAKTQFRALAAEAKALGIPVQNLVGWLPRYAGALPPVTTATVSATVAAKQHVAALEAESTAMVKAATDAQSLEGTQDGVRDSIAGLDKSMAKNKTTLNQHTEAGRQNREAILGAVSGISAYGAALVKSGKSNLQAREAMDSMGVDLVKQLVKLGMNKKAADQYVASLLGIPKNRSVALDLKDAQFQAKMNDIRTKMAAINGLTSDVYINAVASGVDPQQAARINRNAKFGAHGGTTGSARFGAISGLAMGGTGGTVRGPGTAATDTAGLYHLANGEEVVSNLFGQADKWRPFLKAINAGRVDARAFNGIGGRKDGGTTVKTVNVGGVHLHSPVAKDPLQAAEDASQLITAYAGFPL